MITSDLLFWMGEIILAHYHEAMAAMDGYGSVYSEIPGPAHQQLAGSCGWMTIHHLR